MPLTLYKGELLLRGLCLNMLSVVKLIRLDCSVLIRVLRLTMALCLMPMTAMLCPVWVSMLVPMSPAARVALGSAMTTRLVWLMTVVRLLRERILLMLLMVFGECPMLSIATLSVR